MGKEKLVLMIEGQEWENARILKLLRETVEEATAPKKETKKRGGGLAAFLKKKKAETSSVAPAPASDKENLILL